MFGLWVGTAILTFAMARAMREALRAPALLRTNYAGREVSTAGGIAAVAGFALSLGFVSALGSTDADFAFAGALVVFGFAAIGFFDDVVGGHMARGFRGHVSALGRGELTSGMVKLAVGVGIAAIAALTLDDSLGHRLLDVIVIAGSANVANLLDLRPVRAAKVAIIVSVGLLVATRADRLVAGQLWFVAAVTGLIPGERREEFMLGDTGANALGAALGVAIVCACSSQTAYLALAAACVVLINVAGELVSFGEVIDRVPPLRAFDRWGRRP